jgi:hypothetical protein
MKVFPSSFSDTPLNPIEKPLPLPNTHHRFPVNNHLNPVSIDSARLHPLQMPQSLIQQKPLLVRRDYLQMVLLANFGTVVVIKRHDSREYHLSYSIPVFEVDPKGCVFEFEVLGGPAQGTVDLGE